MDGPGNRPSSSRREEHDPWLRLQQQVVLKGQGMAGGRRVRNVCAAPARKLMFWRTLADFTSSPPSPRTQIAKRSSGVTDIPSSGAQVRGFSCWCAVRAPCVLRRCIDRCRRRRRRRAARYRTLIRSNAPLPQKLYSHKTATPCRSHTQRRPHAGGRRPGGEQRPAARGARRRARRRGSALGGARGARRGGGRRRLGARRRRPPRAAGAR